MNLTIGNVQGSAIGGDIDPEREFVARINRDGHVVVRSADRPWNHFVAGVGVGHQDAEFCERRGEEGSMAAYYENGAAFGGRWWENTASPCSVGVRYYGCAARRAS